MNIERLRPSLEIFDGKNDGRYFKILHTNRRGYTFAVARVALMQSYIPGSMYLFDLFVDPRFRQIGLGKQLLKLGFHQTQVCLCNRLILNVLITNEPAIALYKGAGMHRLPKLFVGKTEYRYAKTIDAETNYLEGALNYSNSINWEW